MKGDFSRRTFDPRKHFTRVLMQQGRVQLDADRNEQTAILLHYLRALAADLIGPRGGPGDSFKVVKRRDEDGNEVERDFQIQPGHYYVDGILCENNRELVYTAQPDYPLPDDGAFKSGEYLVYLDVWERHVTYIEDPAIREVALGGPDTATRAKVVWQVKVLSEGLEGDGEENEQRIEKLKRELKALEEELEQAEEAGAAEEDIQALKAEIRRIQRKIDRLQEGGGMPSAVRCEELVRKKLVEPNKPEPSLRAQAYVETPPEDACITPPEARYRGAENQLYRVEIHRGGKAGEATFKWSRDNGSVVAAWIGQQDDDLIVSGVRDRRRGFAAEQWVELSNDERELQGKPGTMVQVTKAEGDRVTIDPNTASDGVNWSEDLKNPKVRRWDHGGFRRGPRQGKRPVKLSLGAVPVEEGTWLDLEDGIRIKFEPDGTYRTGDYWLIPARTATGDVMWPKERDEEGKLKLDDGNPIPKALPPHGVEHHYAPLAVISIQDDGTVEIEEEGDCRRTFKPLTELQ